MNLNIQIKKVKGFIYGEKGQGTTEEEFSDFKDRNYSYAELIDENGILWVVDETYSTVYHAEHPLLNIRASSDCEEFGGFHLEISDKKDMLEYLKCVTEEQSVKEQETNKTQETAIQKITETKQWLAEIEDLYNSSKGVDLLRLSLMRDEIVELQGCAVDLTRITTNLIKEEQIRWEITYRNRKGD
jgi:hypothetical protein